MNKLLILFANGFPYGISEPFLENEIPLYQEYFDKVLLITACDPGAVPTRMIKNPIIEVIPDYTLSKDLPSVLEAVPSVLTDSLFYKEIKNLFLREGFSLRRLYDLLVLSLCGNHRAMLAHRWLQKHPEYTSVVIYSYWMQIPAYSAVRLNQINRSHFYTLSRAHGFDLYLERSQTGYVPFHKQLYHHLNEIAVISEHGKKYLEDRYGDLGKVTVHRLGAVDHGCLNPSSDRNILRIVTCSRTVPLKRLDRLVDALSRIVDRQIHWTHLGGGPVQEELERYASEKLPDNVTTTFYGTIPNAQIYEIYKTQPFHVFVNVSETEGVPVAIMEAMSFGIPVIATAVGGTPELVDEGSNGWLLPKDFNDAQLVENINRISQISDAIYLSMRNMARAKFEQEYSAKKNYHKTLAHLASHTNTQM